MKHWNETHGHTKGRHLSPAYISWRSMFQRCFNKRCKAYASYGGRGITVCRRWFKFENFYADMGPRPIGKSLDRYPDNNGDYKPGNCRWATPKEQANNERHEAFNKGWFRPGIDSRRVHGHEYMNGNTYANNITVTINGVTKRLAVWCKETGVKSRTARARISRHGWGPALAVITPARKRKDSK